MEAIRIIYIEQNKLAQMGIHGLIYEQEEAFHIDDYENFDDVELHHLVDANVILLSDYGLEFEAVYAIIEKIRDTAPHSKIVLIGYRVVAPYIYHLIELGIQGFIFWDNVPDKLCMGIEAIVGSNIMCFCDRAAEVIRHIQEWGTEQKFSSIDLQVLHKLSEGMTVQEIAICMNLSKDTIYNTRKRIKKKLGINNTDTLIDVARRYNLLDPKS